MGIRTHTIGIAALIIGVLLFSALLVPIVANSSATTETRSNVVGTGINYYEVGPTEIVSDGTTITVDGETVASRSLLVIGPNFVFRSDGLRWFHDNALTSVAIESGNPWTFTVTDRSVALVYGGVTTGFGAVASKIVHAVNTGSYINLSSNTAALNKYINVNSQIFLFSGPSQSNQWMYYGSGTLKQTMPVEHYTSSGHTWETVALTISDTDMAGVYTTSVPDSYYVIIPVEYQAPATASGTVYTILNILPIIALLGIVMAAAYFAANRD